MIHELNLDAEPVSARRPDNVTIASLVAGVILFVLIAALFATRDDPAPAVELTRSTFTDSAGRTCTQVTTGPAVAIDCDFPPAENRLGGFLNDLEN